MGKKDGRYELDNSSIPTQSSISESDRAEMEEFLANIRLLVSTLGHKVFDEKREKLNQLSDDVSLTVFIKGARGAEAQGMRTTEGFLVFKGAKAVKDTAKSFPKSFIALRQKLIETDVLVERSDVFLFKEDYIFGSPSTAAMVILGRTSNGLNEWKDKSGASLKTIETKSK